MCQRAVDRVGDDDRVLLVRHIGVYCGQSSVGEERVVAPHRKQRGSMAFVFHPAHHQAGSDLVAGAGERGIDSVGDLRVRDQLAGVGVEDRLGLPHWCPGSVADRGDSRPGDDFLQIGQTRLTRMTEAARLLGTIAKCGRQPARGRK